MRLLPRWPRAWRRRNCWRGGLGEFASATPMSQSFALHDGDRTGWLLAGAMFGIASMATVLAGWAGLASRWPPFSCSPGPITGWKHATSSADCQHTGTMWCFFLVSFLGILGLTVSFALLPSYFLQGAAADPETQIFGYAAWNTLLVLWIASLVWMRHGPIRGSRRPGSGRLPFW